MLTEQERAELWQCSDAYLAHEWARSHGFVNISNGCFAGVYQRDADSVLKIGRTELDGWLKYAELCQCASEHNPAFLRVYWHRLLSGSGYVAEIEALQHHPGRFDDSLLPRWLRNVKEYLQVRFYPGIANCPDMSDAPANVVAALDAIAAYSGAGHGPDLHNGNWMLRGDQVVITDPLA